MTPKIIYKQQHVGENGRKYTASRNAHYVRYIGEREHVLKTSHETNLVKYMGEREHAAKQINKVVKETEAAKLITHDMDIDDNTVIEYDNTPDGVSEEMQKEPENGLFGYINGKFSDSLSTSEMQNYVRKVSSPNRNVFHSIFSFTPESADEAGLKSLNDWEEWVKYHVSEIADCMNMKIENIEYLAAVHLKENQPHVHIMWWDKKQQILINKVDPLVCDAIRISAIKSTYREQFNALHNREDELTKILRGQIAQQAESILAESVPDDYTDTIGKCLNHIGDILPPKGQLVYKFMEPEVKAEIDRLTHYIIDNNPHFSQLYDSILEQRRLYNEMLHGTDDDASNWSKYKLAKYTGKLNDDIERTIGNALLKIIKREKKEGRQKLIEALDSVPIEESPSGRWQQLSERESFKLFVWWTKRFKNARTAAKEMRYDDALKLYKQEAESGNALAEYEIADLYRKGLVNGKGQSAEHYRKALTGFLEAEKSADRMKPYLQYRIGRMYFDGYGTNQNYAEALKWLEMSAEGGNKLAANTLAAMYREGKGTAQNPQKAAEIYEKNCNDNPYLAFMLAKMYLKGDEISKDLGKAFSLLNKAKTLNPKLASSVNYTLGAAYMYDNSIRNSEFAMKYLNLSAKAGNKFARNLINNTKMWEQRNITNLLGSVMNILETNAQDGSNALSEGAAAVFGCGDLSREAIAELLMKLQDKQNTAEM